MKVMFPAVPAVPIEFLGKVRQLAKLLRLERKKGYATPYAFMEPPFDEVAAAQIKELASKKQQSPITLLVVIGMGGSILGTKAVYEALSPYGISETKLLFVQSIYADIVSLQLQEVREVLQVGGRVVLNVVSKSGRTTETIALFSLFLAELEGFYGSKMAEHVVVTTDKESVLWDFAQEKNVACLAIPKTVGGRFSVFTAAGLFPLACAGVAIDDLLCGARLAGEQAVQDDSTALRSAAIVYALAAHGINSYNLFLFHDALAGVGAWVRQLFGESLGKERNTEGVVVNAGITPLVSLGTADLHSVLQLYLGGPQDKMTSFVLVQQSHTVLSVPEHKGLGNLVPHITTLSLQKISLAIEQGVLAAYDTKKLPYTVVTLEKLCARELGELLQWKLFEVVYIGWLLDVNPFNQPEVELYKKEARRLLVKMN